MLAALVMAVMTALAVGSARAATVTVGSPLAGTFAPEMTFGTASRANLTLPPPANVASPVDGTAIRWSFIGAQLTPRIFRPVGGGLYTGAGTGPAQAGVGANAISGPFAINLPVRAGDLIGVDTAGVSSTWSSRATPGAQRAVWQPLGDGAPGDAPTIAQGQELAVQAVVRYCLVPKLKGKKPKKAESALRAADCTVGQVRKGRKARKRRVVKQSVSPGSSISDTRPVDFKVSRKR
jgi:PASTA domain